MSFSIKGPARVLDFSSPRIMGILNLTPDSFYDGSRSLDISQIVDTAGRMIDEGTDILDLGAVSSRPGSIEPSVSEEIDRILGPLMAVRSNFPDVIISLDTYRSKVLQTCLDARINLVNDISGGAMDDRFLSSVALAKLPYILMHMKGVPKNMQQNPTYEDVILDMMKFFDRKLDECRQSGINEIIIDPGFGFGKTLVDNYRILAHLESFKIFKCPILVGISRKSMIQKVVHQAPGEALNGSTAAHMLALQNGAKILRVHDVKEAKECIDMWKQYQNCI